MPSKQDQTERLPVVDAYKEPRVTSDDPLERFVNEELFLHWHHWVRANDLHDALWRWYVDQEITEVPYILDLNLLLLGNMVIRATTRAGTQVYLGVALASAREAQARFAARNRQ